jgi:small subunit ribosomal protein S6
MRRYETVAIVDPDLASEERGPFFDRVAELFEQQGGLLVATDKWGTRKLAYPIKKKERGYYVRFDFCGNGPVVDELERFFRIDDRVLKYMTVLLEESVDIEKIKEAMTPQEAEDTVEPDGNEAEASPATAAKEPPDAEPAPELEEADTAKADVTPSAENSTTIKGEED